MASCSVVMVSYHTGEVLFPAIKSVLSQPHLAELIIIDNGNPLATIQRLHALAAGDSRLKFVTGGGNVGFGKANNAGAKLATGDFILLLNPDCILPPEALQGIMLGFGEVAGAMLAGCSLQNPDGSEQRGGRRALLTPSSALGEATGTRKLNYNKTPMPDATHEVPAISGACMCLRRADFEKLGGFDESFFLHVEDMDLCMRVHKAGGKVICVPRVKVTHMLSTSGEVTSRFIEWQKTKGFIRYFHKHFRTPKERALVLLADFGILARFIVRLALAPLKDRLSARASRKARIAARKLMILATGLASLPETREFHGKIVIVTGATSGVGLCVVRRLIAAGAGVLAISRGEELPFRHPHLRWIQGDLTDVSLHLNNYLADVVVHCAPLWHLPDVVHMFADAEVSRVVAIGSTSVFAKAKSGNSYEQDIVHQLADAEEEIAAKCNTRGMRWTILRPTMIYGLGLDANITSLAYFIRRFKFFPVYPPAEGRRQPVHADDLAIAVMQTLNAPATFGKAYNVSGGEVMSYHQMLECLFKLTGTKLRIVTCKWLPFMLDVAGRLLQKNYLNGEIARRMNEDLVFFHDDARRDFAYAPRTFLSGGTKDLEGF